MLCPFCSSQVPEKWQPLSVTTAGDGSPLSKSSKFIHEKLGSKDDGFEYVEIQIMWMKCHDDKCGQVIVCIDRTLTNGKSPGMGKLGGLHSVLSGEKHDIPYQEPKVDSWIAVPKQIEPPPLDVLIPEKYRRNHREASLILKASPRMSAVLSRSVLADLLQDYAGLGTFKLSTRIDKFIEDNRHPSRLRDNLHYLREIADFGAHTQTDVNDDIIEVTVEEAEWTIKIVSDLFDYFIVGPEKDKAMRKAFDEKIRRAGRKEIRPLNEGGTED